MRCHRPTRVEAEGDRVLGEVFILERVLILVQQVVHRPEPSLCAGRVSGFGRMRGVRMHAGNREVAVSEAQLIAQAVLNHFDDRMNFAADGTFKITIFQKSYRGPNVALDVIPSGDRESIFAAGMPG